jgi:hypothetical protein
MTTDSSSRNKVPAWATKSFEAFLNQIEELSQVTDLSVRGISMTRASPQIVAAITKATGRDEGGKEKEFTRLAELAQREVDRGFPILFAQATISIWGILEAMVKDLLLDWLAHEPLAMQVDAVRKIKISLSQYEAMNVEERRYYILDTLERDIQSGLKQGISRFETLLDCFGLSGPVDSQIQKDMFELSTVRNVLVHRKGVADKRFIDACPWLGIKMGDAVTVNNHRFKSYVNSSIAYIMIIFKRVSVRFDVELWQDQNGEWQVQNIDKEATPSSTPTGIEKVQTTNRETV